MSTFSFTLIFGKSAFDCGTCDTPSARICAGCIPRSDFPSSSISPFRGWSSPLIARSTVDLPAPFGPTMQHTERWGTSKSTPWRTSPPPYPANTSFSLSTSHLHRLVQPEVLSEIRVEHRRVALDLGGGPPGDGLAAGEHEHRRAEPQHERHV